MPEQEVAFAEPEENRRPAETDASAQPEFVVGMPVAQTEEADNSSDTTAELPQFVVDQEALKQAQAAEFTQYQADFAALDTQTLGYVLEQFTTEKLQEVSALDAAGMLLALKNNSELDLTEEKKLLLEDRLQLDPQVAERYWQEVYVSDDPTELAEAVEALAQEDLQVDVSGSELKAATEALSRQEAALQQLQEESPILAEAVQLLETETARREGIVAAATEQVTAAEAEVDPVVAEIEHGAQIEEVTNAGEHLEVTVTNPDGTKKKTKVKEESLFGQMMLAVLSDTLLGTHNTERIMEVWLKHKVVAPLLDKFGLDSSVLFSSQFGRDKFKPMDGMLKTMNEFSCRQYFEQVMTGQYLYETLEILDPEHLKKIFDPTGTKPFGKSGYLSYDHLKLPQEVVDKMYETLTDRQREKLYIPQKGAPAAPQAQPAV